MGIDYDSSIATEPVTYAYRYWRLLAGNRLGSPIVTGRPDWAPGLNRAYCASEDTCPAQSGKLADTHLHGCGLYGFRLDEQTGTCPNTYFNLATGTGRCPYAQSHQIVVGCVALWCAVDIGESMIRARYGAPAALCFPSQTSKEHRQHIAAAAAHYGIQTASPKELASAARQFVTEGLPALGMNQEDYAREAVSIA